MYGFSKKTVHIQLHKDTEETPPKSKLKSWPQHRKAISKAQRRYTEAK